MSFRLRDTDTSLRLFLTAFLLVLGCGYAVGLFFVSHETAGTPGGVVQQFRGGPEDPVQGDMKFEKSPREMYVFVHNHLIGLSLVFLALGGIFWWSSLLPPIWKTVIMVEPMLALLTTFGGIVLMRFVSPEFVWLVLLSAAGVHLGFIAMTVLILTELWWAPRG